MGPDWFEPRTLQHWPGKMISELANKVPTSLQYDDRTGEIKAWGFLCDLDDEEANTLTCFKLYLDPAYKDTRPEAPTLAEARRWYQDYLRCVHDHIAQQFNASYPSWRRQRVEFIFSVPTTWKSPAMIARTEDLIQGAGFGTDGAQHRAKIGLTEAEAAAVYSLQQRFNVSAPDSLTILWRDFALTDKM